MKSSTYPWASAEAFEQFLRGQGFPAHQAHAITTKGFGRGFSGNDANTEIADLVSFLRRKSMRFETEVKSMQTKELYLYPGRWTGFIPVGVITATEPSEFKLMVSRYNPGNQQSPIRLEIKYMSRDSGPTIQTWMSNANPAQCHRYLIPAGMQEILVNGTVATYPDRVKVSIY